MELIDLTGKIFGDWLVLSQEKNQFWLCKCKCGNEKLVKSYDLRKGKTVKCRDCWKLQKKGIVKTEQNKKIEENDLTGKKIGKWTVLSKINPVEKGLVFWLCRCECGLEKPVYSSHLRLNKTESCRKCSNHKHKGKLNSVLLARIKGGAKQRNIYFDESKEFKKYIYDLFYAEQKEICALSGQKITISNFGKDQMKGNSTASLDRIDSSKGYEKGNVQWVHKNFNAMKWGFSQEEFLNNCRLVVEYLGKNKKC